MYRFSQALLAACLVVAAASSASEAKLIKVTEIPDPFSKNLVFYKPLRAIQLIGLVHTDPDVVKRSMASKVGELYTEETAQLDSKWLTQLGIFTAVSFATIDEPDSLILEVRVIEVSPYIPAPSVKVTEENGWEIGVQLSSANLRGSAARLSAWLRVGGATNVGFRLQNPWFPGGKWWNGMRFDYFHMERKNKVFNFDEKADDILWIYMYNLSQSLSLGPRFTALRLHSDQDGITLQDDNSDLILGGGISLQYNTRNLMTYPTNGWWTELLLMKQGNDSDYWQVNLDVRRYFHMPNRRGSLTLYSLLTYTTGEVGVDVPIYSQFALGGANTVRGWELGERVGKNQFINTIEYWVLALDYRQYEFWFLRMPLAIQTALFLDAGTAWTDGDSFSQNWIAGGGIGVRLLYPSLVMVRFDVGYGQASINLNFFIGSKEKAEAQRDRVR